jgi:hypothetical protein
MYETDASNNLRVGSLSGNAFFKEIEIKKIKY